MTMRHTGRGLRLPRNTGASLATRIFSRSPLPVALLILLLRDEPQLRCEMGVSRYVEPLGTVP